MKAFSNHIASLAARVCVVCVGMRHTHTHHVDGDLLMVQLRINQTGIYLEDSLAALRPADMNKQVVCIVLSLVGEKKRLLD